MENSDSSVLSGGAGRGEAAKPQEDPRPDPPPSVNGAEEQPEKKTIDQRCKETDGQEEDNDSTESAVLELVEVIAENEGEEEPGEPTTEDCDIIELTEIVEDEPVAAAASGEYVLGTARTEPDELPGNERGAGPDQSQIASESEPPTTRRSKPWRWSRIR